MPDIQMLSLKDIAQIDATIVAGALVFLTISSIGPFQIFEPLLPIKIGNYSSSTVIRLATLGFTEGIIIPFSFSLFHCLEGHYKEAVRACKWGTALLALLLAYIIIIYALIHPFSSSTP